MPFLLSGGKGLVSSILLQIDIYDKTWILQQFDFAD